MARAPRDYKKLYKEATIDLVIENGTRTKALEMLKESQNKYENLNKEFDKADFPKYYPIIKEYPIIRCSQIDKVEYISNINDGDDINLPINGAYYKIPTSTNNDYMYAKIASHLVNSINTNYRNDKHSNNTN